PLSVVSSKGQPATDNGSRTAEYYQRFHELIEGGLGCTEAVVINEQTAGLPPGRRYLFDDKSQLVGHIGEGVVPANVREHLAPIQK
ncbi:hypothetical protein, partial [Salmonella sp. SAL4436]|uniref:hypothetical protein n=1 Tax=Salmonella sp. SAL4436 TaxID=3159891 RepID=UPI00397B9ED5